MRSRLRSCLLTYPFVHLLWESVNCWSVNDQSLHFIGSCGYNPFLFFTHLLICLLWLAAIESKSFSQSKYWKDHWQMMVGKDFALQWRTAASSSTQATSSNTPWSGSWWHMHTHLQAFIDPLWTIDVTMQMVWVLPLVSHTSWKMVCRAEIASSFPLNSPPWSWPLTNI
jgi:hypothetical protein